MKYKTNAKCGGCTAAILKALEPVSAASNWSFDLSSPDKTLTFVGSGAEPEADKVIEAIKGAGFQAELLS